MININIFERNLKIKRFFSNVFPTHGEQKIMNTGRTIKREQFDPSFSKLVEEVAGTDIYACYQCGMCSGGCPVSFMMDYTPRQIMRMSQLGMKDDVLSSTTIWLCASCNTCFARCPREIDLPEVMATLKSRAIKEGFPSKIREGQILYKIMVENMKKYGRVHEAEVFVKFASKAGINKLVKQLPMGLTLFRKRKLKLSPEKIKSVEQLKTLIQSVKQIEEEEEKENKEG